MISADKLDKGRDSEVVFLKCGTALRRRLIDLGITPGASITFIRQAPLGDPIIFKVRGYKIGIRKKEAVKILAEYTEGSVSVAVHNSSRRQSELRKNHAF